MLPCLVLAQASYDLDAAANDVARQLAQRFPPLQGEVVEVQGEQLYLSLGARDQVFEGMRLNVFREGEELISPSTGEVLGRLEEDLGTVRVTQVSETYAVAMLTDAVGGAAVQAGDKVRITAGRLSLALLPVTDQTTSAVPLAALADAVQRGLDATGRFNVVPRARLTLWLLERNLSPGDVLSPDIMSEVASVLDVAYVAQPVLRVTGDTAVVELRLFAPAQPQTPVTTALAILSEAVAMPQRPGVAARFSTSRRRFHAANPPRIPACRGGSGVPGAGERPDDAAGACSASTRLPWRSATWRWRNFRLSYAALMPWISTVTARPSW